MKHRIMLAVVCLASVFHLSCDRVKDAIGPDRSSVARIEIKFSFRGNWDTSDPEDDGIELTIWFWDKDGARTYAPRIETVEVVLGTDNNFDDRPDVPLLIDRQSVATYSIGQNVLDQEAGAETMTLRIANELYQNKVDRRRDFEFGIVDVYITTKDGTIFSDRNDLAKLW